MPPRDAVKLNQRRPCFATAVARRGSAALGSAPQLRCRTGGVSVILEKP